MIKMATEDQKLYHSKVDLARQLFRALDSEVLLGYERFRQGEGEYPSEKSVLALIEGVRHGLGKSRSLEIMNKNMADDTVTYECKERSK